MTPAAALATLGRFAVQETSGMRPGLERIEALLGRLGHPERALPVIHVAGTNGKGSVAASAEAVLRAAGHRTGLYTSPHLLDLRERVRLDGEPITPEALAPLVARLAPALDAGRATFFEAMTAIAFAAFRDHGVTAAVVEVGLGGRWDATNVGAPRVAVVTRIDHDHQQYLGTRLEEIAAEKAAIVRGGVALSAAQAPPAAAVVASRCREVGVPLLVEGRELTVEVARADRGGHRVHLAVDGRAAGLGPPWRLADVELALHGVFQPANAVLAVGAARAFAAAIGRPVADQAVRAGLAGVRWPGRFQVASPPGARPVLLLDGAHNPGGAAALAASIRNEFPGAALTLVIGISADKDRPGILTEIAPLARRIVLTAAPHPRATPPAELAADLPPGDADVIQEPSPAAAIRRALADPGADVVCVAGSLFLVAEALRMMEPGGSGRLAVSLPEGSARAAPGDGRA